MSFRIVCVCLILISLSGCSLVNSSADMAVKPLPLLAPIHRESVAREFRAAWVATVANINWPTEAGLSTLEQQAQAIEILDLLQKNNFNTVIFQVRPQADALYQSRFEPWSYYLTAEQGKAPEPFYDPLQFWIEQAHQRGLKLHAWINPYRVHHPVSNDPSEQSMAYQMPDDVVKLKNGMHWFIPTNQSVIAHTIATLSDLVTQYDIDGIHFDDYFYPYSSYNEEADFPDQAHYQHYLDTGGSLAKADWRRDAVNQFVQGLYQQVKAIKPHVQVGISPFGIYRPKQPHTIRGLDQYETLFADAKLWLNKGWLDYFTPQLYWPIKQYSQSYPLLLGWWQSENTLQRHVWPGINALIADNEKGIDEVINQIMINRGMLSSSPGVVFWNVKSLQNSAEFRDVIGNGVFQHQALLPRSAWLDNTPPSPPSVTFKQYQNNTRIFWQHKNDEEVFSTLVYVQYANESSYRIYPHAIRSLSLPNDKNGKRLREVKIIAIDRNDNESESSEVIFSH
ncbi:glycoside hydrolase family 10 protein [Pseudoalteromonas mariniglutinosa]|uniref:glycoside hydrolase family 10 protein n=1 Tax=Pseudoalteromonas mariniglutinosa TaxID=206042 RepID=UPI00384ADBAB